MKKIVLTMVALLSMTVMQAQTDNKSERKAPKQPTPEEMTEHMAKDLNLNTDQKAKVLALNKEYQDVLKGGPRGPRGPRPDGQGGPKGGKKQKGNKQSKADQQQPKTDAQTGATEQRPERPQLTDEQKAKMKAQMEKRKEYDGKLKQILTDEQYKKFQKAHKRHGHGPHHGGPRPEKTQKSQKSQQD